MDRSLGQYVGTETGKIQMLFAKIGCFGLLLRSIEVISLCLIGPSG